MDLNNNMDDIVRAIESIRINRPILNEILAISNAYYNERSDKKVDDHILFELELLRDKVDEILFGFYYGDIEHQHSKGVISFEERDRLLTLQRSRYTPEGVRSLSFNFGYLNNEFMDKLSEEPWKRMKK